jgi:hypothetical protein
MQEERNSMAAEWIPCGGGFIAADVMRWNEGVWQRLRRRRGGLVNIGDPVITAEVLRDEGGWLDLLIRGCAVASEKPGQKVSALALC